MPSFAKGIIIIMKKFMNDKANLVTDMLKGYVAAFPDRVKLQGTNVLCRKQAKEAGKVPVLIANGSGHEPAMIDLVGKGLFDANVCGHIFTAPSPVAMMEGIRAVHNGMPILLLVSSHSGDIFNAKMAIVLAKAEDIDVQMVVLWDDIASAPKGKEHDRRGTAGLFFNFKIVCAAAEAGMGIEDLITLAEKVRDNTRTLSVAVNGGTHPETGLPTAVLPEDEIEVGMGVHGEKGSGRMKMPTSDAICDYLLDKLCEDKPFVSGDEVMVLINNAGATTRMELMILFGDVEKKLSAKGIKVVRNWVGTYVTTQEAAGFALSICKADEEMLKYYDEPADSPLF